MKFSQAKARFVVGLAVGLTFSGIGVTASAQNNFGPDPFANHYSGEGAVPNTQNGPRATNPFLAGLFGFISDSARSFRPATRTTFGAGPGNFAGNPGFTNGSGLANSGFPNSAGFQGGGFQGGGFQGGGFPGGGFQGGGFQGGGFQGGGFPGGGFQGGGFANGGGFQGGGFANSGGMATGFVNNPNQFASNFQPASGPFGAPQASRNIVGELQMNLSRLGFQTGAIDGIYGPMTANAIGNYQASRGMAPDGQITPGLFQSLRFEVQNRF